MKKKRFVKTLIILITICSIFSLLFYVKNKTTVVISPLPTNVIQQISLSTPLDKSLIKNETQIVNKTRLESVVNKALEGTHGTYAIVIKNLKTGETYVQNEHKVFNSGSLYKLWVMAVVYQQIESGELSKEQIVSQYVTTLNQEFSIDPNQAEITEGTITFTIREALNQMITISHNYAAMLLTEKIKLSRVAKFLEQHGLYESTVGTSGELPTTTALDIAVFLEKLYRKELAGAQYTKEMIDLLKRQQLNSGIPKYLPDQGEVANKTGEIDYFKHDGGIIFSDNGDYILVVMSESDNPKAAQERIAKISEGVYQYFKK